MNLYAAAPQGFGVSSRRLADHLLRIVDADYHAVRGAGSQKLHRHATAAADIQYQISRTDFHQVNGPGGQAPVLNGHDMPEHPPEPPGRLAEVGFHQVQRFEQRLEEEVGLRKRSISHVVS